MAIKLQINRPVELALTRMDPRSFQHGKDVSLMYSIVLTDGTEDKIFLPEHHGRTIQEMRIQKGEFFTVCKRKTAQGSQYIEIKARTSPRSPAPDAPSEFEQQLAESVAQAKAQRAQSPAKASPAAPSSQPQDSQQLQDIPVSPGQTILSQLMAGCMVAAIDAAAIGRDYAHEKGLALSFDQGSIERIAVALLIRTEKMVGLEREAAVIAARVNGGAQSCLQ